MVFQGENFHYLLCSRLMKWLELLRDAGRNLQPYFGAEIVINHGILYDSSLYMFKFLGGPSGKPFGFLHSTKLERQPRTAGKLLETKAERFSDDSPQDPILPGI